MKQQTLNKLYEKLDQAKLVGDKYTARAIENVLAELFHTNGTSKEYSEVEVNMLVEWD